MALLLPKDLLSDSYTKPNLYLCETDKTRICRLETYDTKASLRFNTYSELTCSIDRTYIDFITGQTLTHPYYDKIEALRLIYIDGFGYFEIQDPDIYSDGIKETKTISAYSLEYNLSQKYLENFYVNTGEVNSIEVIYSIDQKTKVTPVTLYDPTNPKLSLLNLILEKIYGWKIGHVDSSLCTMSRTFDVSRASVYDFLTQDVCEKFNCYIIFDTVENTINVYAESLITKFTGDGSTTSFIVASKYDSLSTVSINGYKTTAYTYNKSTGELIFDEAPPASENGLANIEVVDGSQENWITDVYITFDNLAQEVNINYSADDIKTVLTVKGADDLNIREVNFGLPYITDLSYYYSVDWMGQDLYDAYTKYLKKCNEKQAQYTETATDMLELSNYINYETNRLSLKYSIANVTNETVGTYYVRGGTAPNYYYTEVTLPRDYKVVVNDTAVARQLEIQMVTEYPNSAVNLLARPMVSWRAMVAAGYDEFKNGEDDEYATVYSISLSSENFSIKDDNGKYFEVLLTPILPNGEVIKNGQLVNHVRRELEKGQKLTELNIYIGSYSTAKEATSAAERLHKLQEQYYALRSGYYYYTLSGNDLNETKFSKLYTALQNYFASEGSKDVSDFEDLKEPFAFVETYTLDNLVYDLKSASNIDAKNTAVNKFLDEIWKQLGTIPLQSLYYAAYEKIQITNEEAGWNEEGNENYWRYYPVTLVLDSIDKAIEERKKTINVYQTEYDELAASNNKISSDLLISNPDNFSHQQLVRLSSFLREDEYTDDNFVETESDTIDSIMQTKQELLECGRIELAKLCEPKLAFSMDMANIYALREFEPIIHQFQLGNLVNVAIRNDYIKKARLLEVDINFDDFTDFSCEFGELTNLKTPSSIHADLLANALSAGKSVASNASYWNKGTDLATSTDLKIQQGLLNSITGLYSSDQGVIIDKSGIRLTKVVNKETGEVSPKQAWIVNNNILFSSDGFETSKTGLGEFTIDGHTIYGLLADAVLAGYVESSTIVGGTINIGDGTFVVNNDGSVVMKASSIDGYVAEHGVVSAINQSAEKIKIDANKISLKGKTIDLTSDNIIIDSTNFSVDKDGKITAKSGSIAGWDILPALFRKETTVDGVDYQIYMQAADGVETSNAFAVRKKNSGSTDGWDYQFKVNYKGILTAKDADISGTITAQAGSIAGYNIGKDGYYKSDAIYKRIDAGSTDYEVGMKATSGDTDLAFYVKESTDNWETASNNFYIRNDGRLYANNADIAGKITASSGSIGSWNIGDIGGYTDSIYSTYCAASTPSSDNPEYAIFMRGKGSSASTIAIAVKKRTSSSTDWSDAEETFYVLKNGRTKMADADVTGKINASSGKILGNLDISGSLINTQGNYTVTLRGVQSDAGKGVFYITDNSSGSAEYPVRINGDGSARFTNVTITGNSTIASACIPNLNANKITAGTLDVDRIPNISAGKITSGTISTSLLDASVITTGNFSSKSLSTGNLSVTSGGNIGVWTVNSNNYLYAISGNYGVSLSPTSVSHGQGGSATWVSIVTAGQNASDKRLKDNIVEFDDKLDNVFDNLKPVQFEYSKGFLGKGKRFGYIAQDVIDAFEQENQNINDYSFIYETEIEDNSTDKYYQLNKTDFIALNTWQIQKLKSRIEGLERKLAALEA